MRFLVICLLCFFIATPLLPAAQKKQPKIRHTKDFHGTTYKYKKPGKYKRPKIQAQKWKPTKEQRKASKSPVSLLK